MVLRQPARDIEMIMLFIPQHAGEGLAENASPVLIEVKWRDRVVKCISFSAAPSEDLIEGSAKSSIIQIRPLQPQSHGCGAGGRDIE